MQLRASGTPLEQHAAAVARTTVARRPRFGHDGGMPEGDAVRRTARRLDAALAGATLTRGELRVPRFATVDLRGMQVLGTGVVGKHMLTRLIDDRHEWTLHHHLLMDGSWRTGLPGPPRAPTHEIRVWLASATAQAVGVRVHMVEVRDTQDEGHWVDRLGPDILGDEFEADMVAARLAAADRPLAEALLDQQLVSGLGTIWAAELASAVGASPYAPTTQVTGLSAGLAGIRRRMRRSVLTARGTPVREYRVYQRTGRGCRVCGTPIRSGLVGAPPTERRTYWCPSCQPG